MNASMSNQQPSPTRDPQQPPEKGKHPAHPSIEHPPHGEKEMQGRVSMKLTAEEISVYIAKDEKLREIFHTITGLSKENNELREKLEMFQKDNTTMNTKIRSLEDQKLEQRGIIRELESSQEKLQKELENVTKAKERLRNEIEEKNSKLCTENETLRIRNIGKLDTLVKEIKVVEDEERQLKCTLEELKEDAESIREENQQLRESFESLKTEHKEISAKLECKVKKEKLALVLPDQKMGVTGTLKSMKRWLKKNSTTVEGKAAQKRWDELKVKLQWDDEDHKRALSCLKKLRLVDANPENGVAETDKESCEEIINMVKTVKILNNSK